MATNPFDQFDAPAANTFDQFDNPAQKPEKPRTRGAFEAANDTVIEVANAAAGGVSSLANFVRPGNQVSSFIDKNIIKDGESKQSDVVKTAKQTLSEGIQNADGIGGELAAVGKYAVNNPLLAAGQAAGSFALPFGAVKGAEKAATAAKFLGIAPSIAGRAAGVGTGAAMAGGDAAGTAYDLSSKAGATDAQALAAGRQASVIPAVVGGVTGAFGAEKLLAGGAGFKGGIVNRAVKTGLSEAGQEGFEEGVTQYEGQRAAMPYDATIDPTKGVAAAAGMGAIMGGATGAGISLLTGNRDVAKAPPEAAPIDPVQPEIQPTPVIQPTQSEQMGIDRTAGPLSKVAADAVDTGVHAQTIAASITGNSPADQGQNPLQSALQANNIAPDLIANEAINTPAQVENAPIFGSAYAQRQATAPKIEPTDILNTDGKPFLTGFTAKKAATDAGEGFRPFKIAEKQYVVRQFAPENATNKIAEQAIDTTAAPEIEAKNAPKTQAIKAGTNEGTAGAQPAATDTPTRTSPLETTGIVSQPKENDVTETAKTVQATQKGQAPAVPESINAVPNENRVVPADDSSTQLATDSGSTVPAGVVLSERSGSDLPARPAAVSQDAEKAGLGGQPPAIQGTIDRLIGMEEDAGSGFKKNDKAIAIIKRAAENFTPEAKRKVNKVVAEYTSKQKNGETLIKPGFYDAIYDEFAWTIDYLKNATNETVDAQNATQNIATEANNTPASGAIEAVKPVPAGLAKMQAGKAKKEAEANKPKQTLKHRQEAATLSKMEVPRYGSEYSKNILAEAQKTKVLPKSVMVKGGQIVESGGTDKNIETFADFRSAIMGQFRDVTGVLGGDLVSKPQDDVEKAAEKLRDDAEAKSLAKPDERQPIEHKGLKIYPLTMKTGEKKWAIQTLANAQREKNGERQIGGDELSDTLEGAKAAADATIARYEQNTPYRAERKAKEEQEKAAIAAVKADDLSGFLTNKTELQKGFIRKALDKQLRFKDDGVKTLRERVDLLLERGELVTSTQEVPAIQPMTRTQYNRANNQQQEAHEKKMREAGTKTEYYVKDSLLGKTAYDYANFLLAKPEKKPPVAGESITEAATKTVVKNEDSGKGVAMFSRATQPGNWYSELGRQVLANKSSAMPAGMWAGWIESLKTKGVKPDEIEWSGVQDWLKLQAGKVTKADLSNYLSQNGVQVQEIVLGEYSEKTNKLYQELEAKNNGREFDAWAETDQDAWMEGRGKPKETKYSQYQLPGGENYREVLLTLPEKKRPEGLDTLMRIRDTMAITDERQGKIALAVSRIENTLTPYKSSHWDQKNVLAHIRVNDRTDADGKRVLFVEEIQSDWGQDGKKKGFRDESVVNNHKVVKISSTQWNVVDANGIFLSSARTQAAAEAKIKHVVGDGVPLAPFVTATDKWLSLALKRVVKMAVDGGYDKVAFVNGEQSADRYDLSKSVDRLVYDPKTNNLIATDKVHRRIIDKQIDPKDLPDAIGKEAAEKLLNTKRIVVGTGRFAYSAHILENEGLKVGGEGMKAFYDKIVPNTAKEVIRKLGGGQMETSTITTDKNEWKITPPSQTVSGRWMVKSSDYNSKGLQFDTEAEAKSALLEKQETSVQQSFNITEAMREKAAGGVALFSRDNNATGLPATQVKSITDTIKARWSAAPEIVIAANMDDKAIPQAVRDHNNAQLSQGAQGSPEGFLYAGKVYLIADQLATPKDVMRVLFHETLGHVGLRGAFGESLTPILKQIAAMRRAEVAEKAKEYGLDMAKESDRLQAAEEVLAVMAQTKPEMGFVKRAIAAIRTWLRAHGVNLQLSDSDIVANYILPARAFVESGKGAAVGNAAFSRGNSPTDSKDAEYLAAVERGDMATAQRMVDDAAEAAGYSDTVYHGTNNEFYEFDFGKQGKNGQALGSGFYTTNSKDVASGYGSKILKLFQKKSVNAFSNNQKTITKKEVLDIIQEIEKKDEYLLSNYGDIDFDGRKKLLNAAVNDFYTSSKTDPEVYSSIMRMASLENKETAKIIVNVTGKDHLRVNADIASNAAKAGDYVFTVLSSSQLKSADPVTYDDNGNIIPLSQRFNTGNEDIRFSRSIGDTLKAVTVTDIKAKAGNKLADYRNLGLQFLGGRQLADLYGDDIPQIDSYTKMVQQMSADTNEVGAQADAIVTSWAKLTDERQLAELMHDATLMQIDPAKDYVDGDNRMQWGKLNAQFKALTPEAKKIFTDARDSYEEHYSRVREAIQEKIERSAMGKESKARMLERMDGEFFDKIKGVYFPLARFGKYVVVTRDGAGNVVNVSRAETLNEAEALRKDMQTAYPRNSGYAAGKVLKDKEFNASRDAVGRGFLKELFGVLDQQGVGEQLQDAVNQLYLASMPDLSWAKHGIHRKGTPGFSQDARRAYAQNMFHGARYLAKLRFADQLQDKLTAMQDHVDAQKEDESVDSVKGQQIVDEYVARHDSLMNPKSSPLSTALTSFGFVFHMGLSPASAMVNLSGTALVAYPIMGAKWGFNKAAGALLMASKQAASNKNDISKALSKDEKLAYDAAVKAGTIDVTAAHDLAGIAQGEDAGVMWKIRPVMKWASFMFHHAERFNRQVTFVASYRLARGAGVNHEAAFEQATKATYDTHFDYSASNRPRIMQGNIARVALLFKQYGQNMVYTLTRQAQLAMNAETPQGRKEARKALGGLLVMHASAAGVLGLPLVGPLLAAASMLGGSDDEPWDAETALRNMLADTFGQKPAEVMAKGFSRLTPWDLSGRVGLNHLILPDIQEGLEGQRLGESAMAAALGPVAGIGINILKGMQEISEGHVARGYETMMPVALRSPMKALRYEMEGAKDKTGVMIQDEVSSAGVAGQALGFSPSDVRNATEGRSAIFKADSMLMQRRKELMSQYARAATEKDTEAMAEVREAIKKFNDVNPNRRISNMNLMQSVKNKAKRVEEAQSGVFLPKNRRSAIEEGRFAVE